MARMRFFLLLIFSTLAWGRERDPYIVAVTEGDPSATVAGMVNAITGDYYIAEQDLVVRGAEPIVFRRAYVSDKGQGEYAGWMFHAHLQLTFFRKKKIVQFTQPNGTLLHFTYTDNYQKKRKRKRAEGNITFQLDEETQGYVNSSTGHLSALTNLKNTFVEMEKDEKTFYIHEASGVERCYQFYDKGEHGAYLYHLMWERLPNSNVIQYAYDEEQRLAEISTHNSTLTRTYAWAKLRYTGPHPHEESDCEVTTSDGRVLHYLFAKRSDEDQLLMMQVVSPENPHEELEYCKENFECGPVVKERAWPDGRRVQVRYYKHNTTSYVHGEKIKLDEIYDERSDRVKAIYTSSGDGNELELLYEFIYEVGKRTHVFDVYGNRTVYHYSYDHVLKKIERFEGTDRLLNSEVFVWGERGGPDAGNLLCKVFYDKSGQPLMARRFSYDPSGNVSEDTLYGTLSGRAGPSLHIDEKGFPEDNGVEHYSKRFTYSEDDLLLSEREDNGREVRYTYLPQTSLLLSKLTYYAQQLCLRESFEYSEENLLVRIIREDGSERHIEERALRRANAFQGLPLEVFEKYGENGREQLLKRTILNYSKQGQLTRKDIFDANNKFRYNLLFTYDEKGRLIKETNPIGQAATTEYNANNQKISFRDYHGQHVQRMSYDKRGQLAAVTQSTPNGEARTIQSHYNKIGQEIRSIDAYGNATQNSYDPLGRLLSKTLPAVEETYGYVQQPTETYQYDGAGNRICTINPNGAETITRFNIYGKPLEITYPDGGVERFFYNLDGSLQEAIDPLGMITRYTYDVFGRLTDKMIFGPGETFFKRETCRYNAFHLLEQWNSAGQVTRYTYDGAGRKISETSDEITTTYAYDSLGFTCREECGDLIKHTSRDLLGRPLLERIEDQNGTLFEQTETAYDAWGNKKTIRRSVDGYLAVEAFAFDAFNRPITQVDALGQTTRITYNDHFRNAHGQYVLQKTHTDPSGIQTIETYDALQRLAVAEKKNSFGELLGREEYFYDPGGNRCRQVSTIPQRDETVTTLWTYSPQGRQVGLTEGAMGPEQRDTHYSYNARGQVDTIRTASGVELHHTYNGVGQLVALQSTDGTISYTYENDPLGRLVQSRDEKTGRTTHRTYDFAGRLLSETLANGLTIENSYDALGRRTAFTLPDQSSIEYSYDAFHLSSVTRLNRQRQKRYTHRYTAYDLSGNLLEEELPFRLGSRTTHYDPAGRTISTFTHHFDQEVLAFDRTGHPLSLLTNNIPSTFTYDDLSQLTQDDAHVYTYDSHYNRLSKDGAPYTLNDTNQLLSAYSYDQEGRPTSKGDLSFSYDALGRLTSAHRNTTRVDFAYDSLHRCISRTSFTLTDNRWVKEDHQDFLYDEQNEIGSVRNGTLFQLRVLGMAPNAESGAAIAIELDNEVYVPMYDLFGNVRVLMNSIFQPMASYTYSAFGEIIEDDSSVDNPWRFFSKRYDPILGLTLFGRRFYDPETGRFLTPDPAGFTDSLNLYAFVLNDPLTRMDLYGLATTDYIKSNLFGESFRFLGDGIYYVASNLLPIGPIQDLMIMLSNFLSGVTRPVAPRSCCPAENIGGNHFNSETRVVYVNGMKNDHEDGRESSGFISDSLAGSGVTFVHHNTQGLVTDMAVAALGKAGFQTESSKKFAEALRSEINTVGGNGRVFVFAHSRGSIELRNALKLLSKEEKRLLHIRTFGSADLFKDRDVGSLKHFISSRDAIVLLSPIRFAKAVFSPESSNVTILPSKGGLFDHSFLGETYREAVREEARKILK